MRRSGVLGPENLTEEGSERVGGNRRTKDRVRVSYLERQESGVDRQREVKTSLDGLLFRV